MKFTVTDLVNEHTLTRGHLLYASYVFLVISTVHSSSGDPFTSTSAPTGIMRMSSSIVIIIFSFLVICSIFMYNKGDHIERQHSLR